MTVAPIHLHATAVAIDGRALLLTGPSGSGKSDLALRLIDRGAQLIADDLVPCIVQNGWPHTLPPPHFAGRIMTREIGMVDVAHINAATPIALALLLSPTPIETPATVTHYGPVHGFHVPALPLFAKTASAPIISELAFQSWGL